MKAVPRGEAQPLVGAAHQYVEALAVEWKPSARLGGVHDDARAVPGSRLGHRIEIRELSVRRLDRADGHDVGSLVDRVRQGLDRDELDVEAASPGP
jgi:hypothetical protein